MFQHLLVPLDGSSRAEQALPVAARLARVSGAAITLVTVVDLAHEALLYQMAEPSLSPQVIDQDLTEARAYLDRVSQRSDLAGVSLDKQVDLGNPALKILSRAEAEIARPIDLIVMSSHGYTGIKRWLLGSVAEKIARHASVPVLILREGEPLRTHARFDGMNALRALVPVDTSARAQDAIPPAAQLVAALSEPEHGHLQLTQIVVPPEQAGATKREEVLREAEQNLEAIGQSIREGLVAQVGPDLHLTISWAVSIDSDIAEGIVRMAENGERVTDASGAERCDLIAMTTHGATGLHRWAVGSITERVLHATRLPLLIVRPADIIEQERRQRASQGQASR
jgi:nucleotide-binding universal stress UspA family protein